jgi:hypothetical protein
VLLLLQMGIPLGSTAAAGLTTTVAAAAALTELAASDAAVQALRQAAAAGLLLLSAQVRVLVEAFAVSALCCSLATQPDRTAPVHAIRRAQHAAYSVHDGQCTATAETFIVCKPSMSLPVTSCDRQHG